MANEPDANTPEPCPICGIRHPVAFQLYHLPGSARSPADCIRSLTDMVVLLMGAVHSMPGGSEALQKRSMEMEGVVVPGTRLPGGKAG